MTKRAKDGPGSKPPKHNNDDLEARDSAKAKKTDAAQRVQVGMFCEKHNRMCYHKFDGICAPYTPDNFLEHTTLLVSPHFFFFGFRSFGFLVGAR